MEKRGAVMKKNKWIIIGCNLVGAVCFGIVSYGHFYRERIELGLLFAGLSIAQLVLAFTNSGFCNGTEKK